MKTVTLYTLVLCCLSMFAFGLPNAPHELTIGEGMHKPFGYYENSPRFSWKLKDNRYGAKQVAYQIELKDEAIEGQRIWDSGRIETDQSVYIDYNGPELKSRQRLFWRVRYWDQENQVSGWSNWEYFELGLLNKNDWEAQWIHQPKKTDFKDVEILKGTYGNSKNSEDVTNTIKTLLEANSLVSTVVGNNLLEKGNERTAHRLPLVIDYRESGIDRKLKLWTGREIEFPQHPIVETPYFRKEFIAPRDLTKGRLYVTARGIFEIEINGVKVGNDAFTPGWTNYFQRIETISYDITPYLQPGQNAIGARVGRGWYAGNIYGGFGGDVPEFLAQVEMTEKSGEISKVVTDETWTYYGDGPVVKAGLYYGEDYDARKEIKGWSEYGFNRANFLPVGVTPISPKIKLSPKRFQTVKAQTKLPAVKLKKLESGKCIFDFGQNMVGWPHLRLPVKKGTKVTVRTAEMLNKDGTLYTENYRNARSTITYIPSEKGFIDWSPTFSFFGFQYIEVSGYDTSFDPVLEWAEGVVLHTDFESSGHFESSHEKLNRLQSNIRWGQRGNFLDIPTDCPQRDERLGWTCDAQVFAPVSLFNFDTHAFWTGWLQSMREHQSKEGAIPVVIPFMLSSFRGTEQFAGWSDALAIIAWELYKRTGDKRVLVENYEAIKLHVALHEKNSHGLIGPDFGFGDWLQPIKEEGALPPSKKRHGLTSKELISTAYFARSTDICAKIAEALNQPDEAKYYHRLFSQIKSAIQREFLNENGRLTTIHETQTGYLLLLGFGLVDDSLVPKVRNRLSTQLKTENNRLNTGFLGTPLINQVLDKSELVEQALGVLFTNEYPSWFYSIDQGATTMWERWNSYSHEAGFGDADMNSFNHYSYGSVGQWIYERLAGLCPDYSEYGGYKKILIRPLFESPLSFAKASFQTRYGEAMVHWKKTDDSIRINVTVPPNTSARLQIPTVDSSKVVFEQGSVDTPFSKVHDGKEIELPLTAGEYQLNFPWKMEN